MRVAKQEFAFQLSNHNLIELHLIDFESQSFDLCQHLFFNNSQSIDLLLVTGSESFQANIEREANRVHLLTISLSEVDRQVNFNCQIQIRHPFTQVGRLLNELLAHHSESEQTLVYGTNQISNLK